MSRMSRLSTMDKPCAAPIFDKVPATPAILNPIPSSSPAFATPAHPIRPFNPHPAVVSKPVILPVLLPPAILRPLAFRTFTKKHSLTLTSSALQVLATFIGKHCGSEWREEGLAEQVLEEVARAWKRGGGGVIVDGDGAPLKEILKNLEAGMSGGKIEQGRTLSRVNSLAAGGDGRSRPDLLMRGDSQSSMGMSGLDMEDDLDDDDISDPQRWLKVVSAYTQPRLVYNVTKKHFDRENTKPTLLPPASHKTNVFRNRYNLIYQRLLRNEAFQIPAMERGPVPGLARSVSTTVTAQQAYKITPIANLLGRNDTPHLLLGLLNISPTGQYQINDLTGSINLDLSRCKAVPEDGAWFVPGMIVLIDGIYEEEEMIGSSALGGGGGIGGTIGGKFIGITIGGPPSERRQVTLGLGGSADGRDTTSGGGFGWVDFLGVGAERAVGSKMRKIEQKTLRCSPKSKSRGRMVIIGEVNLDQPKTLQALKKIFGLYAMEPEGQSPMTFILMGNFVQYAVMARGGSGGSIEYKEYFDSLAAALSDFPTLLSTATFIFVPGDNDGWASAFSGGAAVPVPRKPVPDMFTSRIRRAFATANAEDGGKGDGEAIWTTNPARLSLFGPCHEIVLFRDDMASRMRRNAIKLSSRKIAESVEDEDVDMAESSTPETTFVAPRLMSGTSTGVSDSIKQARKLVKTVLDQAYLSPFRIQQRPVLWDYASALHLYPLPTGLVLCDGDLDAFCVTYEGCLVMNPGRVVKPGRKGVAGWVEFDVVENVGVVREVNF